MTAFPKPQPRSKQRKPLKRSKPMRRKRARRIDRETPAEKRWKVWVHINPCVGTKSFPGHVCGDGINFYFDVQQAHFRNHTGASLKGSNFQSLPMCPNLHRDYDQTKGEFSAKGLEGKKHWFQARLIELRADFELEHGCTPEEWKP